MRDIDHHQHAPSPLDPAHLTDPAEAELSALGRAAADLDDRLARPAIRSDPPRLVPRIGVAVDRRDLGEPNEIVERMALDILAARRDGQHGHLIDLTASGWTQAQAMRWGSTAHAVAADPRIATGDVVERAAADEGTHTDALASIDVERIVAAGEAAVAEAFGETHHGRQTRIGADGTMTEIDPTDDFGGAAA